MNPRAVLAEDESLLREQLRELLAAAWPELSVVALAEDGRQAIHALEEHHPDVLFLDIEMPGLSGLDAAARLQDELPTCRVVIVTTFGRPGYLQRAMAAGAAGFLVKDGPIDGLADAIRRVVAGETVVDPELAGRALRVATNPLTPRERDVLQLLSEGLSNAAIAERMDITLRSAEKYVSSIFSKLGLPDTGGEHRRVLAVLQYLQA